MTANTVSLVDAQARRVLGEYDHHLTFPAADDFAIVYGPNGVGKTKFLEIIHAASRIDGRALSALPFQDATLTFSDGTTLHVGPTHEDVSPPSEKRRVSRELRFTLTQAGGQSADWVYSGTSAEEWLAENTPWRPVDDELWEDIRDGELVTTQDLEQRHPEAFASDALPPVFRGFRRVVKSYLIETQRLRIENAERARPRGFAVRPGVRREHTSKITQHADKMRALVNRAQTEHSTITQQLDRTFPNRVLEGSTAPRDAAQVRQHYEEQNAFRSRLGRVASVALAEALSLPDRDLEDWELRLLSLYLDDAEAKLEPFETLLQKIELLEEIVNTRLLRKKLRVTAREGLVVRRSDDDRTIGLDALSSGEQHEIILMFDLLFNVPEGAMVLIDEPEISLHVVWQLAFIPDVQRIAELSGFRFVVATHSPQIINDDWDKATPLGPEEAPFS
ncbi:AAA family ATPase [Microbacterium sp. BLY]|uniref:AAA family ATPase n=1 Tax=Microbacterium sp. BLY TaxID=2823280 RepID=UPI001B31C66D|nr:AAA family ATPase [Microbacterium sp. BLY]MBP3978493.1 AAA family ATPase [Microbacterium sp. BLY]